MLTKCITNLAIYKYKAHAQPHLYNTNTNYHAKIYQIVQSALAIYKFKADQYTSAHPQPENIIVY